MIEKKPGSGRVLLFGAHPDDAEFHAGAFLVACWRAGHAVRMVSVTDGGAGHHEKSGAELVTIRRQEAAASGRVIGAEYVTWDYPDGGLTASLEVRQRIIREIRQWKPDIVLTHRTIDYHPDHRAVGQAVEDAIFSVTVPAICPDVPALRRDPVLLYTRDPFTRPYPMYGDLMLDTADYMEEIVTMLVCHVTQLFEWLPWHAGTLDKVPHDVAGRRDWAREMFQRHLSHVAKNYRANLVAAYGKEKGQAITHAEIFDIGQLGSPMDPRLKELFPFLRPGNPDGEGHE